MGCIKLKTDYDTIGLQEFVEKSIYNPYNEEPLQVEIIDNNEMVLRNCDKWAVTLNSLDGTFVFEGKTERYYDIDRVMDIRYKFGALFDVMRTEINKQKQKENEDRRFNQCLHQDHNRC